MTVVDLNDALKEKLEKSIKKMMFDTLDYLEDCSTYREKDRRKIEHELKQCEELYMMAAETLLKLNEMEW